MKGLVVSGGKGTRLRPFTYTGAKQLVPLANRPVLFYVLDDLVAAGITDIGIVVGDTGDQIRDAVGDGTRFGCHITYIQQDHPGGLAHAVKTARGWLKDTPFVMYLGDNFIQRGIARYVEAFEASQAAAHLLLYRVPNPQDFGVAELDGNRIISLEEKPAIPRSDLALVGIYLFRSEIHAATDAISPSARGELEITDAIKELLTTGHEVQTNVLDGWWIDTGKMQDMLDANRLVLLELKGRIEGRVAEDCVIQGTVVVEEGARVMGSTLRGPMIVGQNATIEDSYIGPFSSIGAGCVIRGSEIEHTIIMERSEIIDVPHRIESSLIGRDVRVRESLVRPKAYKLMLGDHSTVGIL